MASSTQPFSNYQTLLGQRPDETILLVLHRHWIYPFLYIVRLIGLNILPPLVLLVIYTSVGWGITQNEFSYVSLVLGLSLYYVAIWVLYFYALADYELDIWIITNQRIVDIQQHGLFNRVVSELNIMKVQDVTSEVKGQFQTILNYGTVYVQTAGEQHRFTFRQIPHPEAIARLVVQTNDLALKQVTASNHAVAATTNTQ